MIQERSKRHLCPPVNGSKNISGFPRSEISVDFKIVMARPGKLFTFNKILKSDGKSL